MNRSITANSAQAGFTLIELIVVIVILGILAATALPKFTSLGGDARLASLQAAKGALSSTAAMAKGKYLVNTTGTALTTLMVEGKTINYTTVGNGYPKADSGLADASGLSDDYTVLTGAVTADTTTTPGNAGGQITIIPRSIAGTAAAVNCFVRYTEPTTKTAAPIIALTATATACE
ncbi:type II secretion system protein [Massilia cavernae]|uniref:Prepilin-type N-terminal cleavage/methylation domain-containing protein n=1 Tax=Massilia cavernae TaxID=2320864 RepID=A0A418Y7D0_9BURK|nr:prepilin-type N-terminal cleavage/methylation domain-containing protein [Massilia cavernae]RJG25820.1 prepilin-type N-terminal cleavage/methylation domain-containing protein [Massilia cavernae]